MKNAGIFLLIIGVALSAAYGARLSPTMRAQAVIQGEAQLRGGAATAANAAYCEALLERRGDDPESSVGERAREVAEGDGCEPSAEGVEEEASRVDVAAICAQRNAGGQTLEQIEAAAREPIDALRGTDVSDLGAELAEKRAAWIAALDAVVQPAARASMLEPPPPRRRLSEWFADSGTLFLLGLVLVVIGSVLGRIAVRREATREDPKDETGDAKDFGEMLATLRDEVAALAEGVASNEAPEPGDFDELKAKVTDLQMERFEPIVASAPRVRAKYGMGGFAEIFGPLSSAERYINRAWSALVDRHWPEASRSIERAAGYLEAAHAALEKQTTS